MHAGFAEYEEIDIFSWLSHAFDLMYMVVVNMDPLLF